MREIVSRWGIDKSDCESLIDGLLDVTGVNDFFDQVRYRPLLLSVGKRFIAGKSDADVASICNNLASCYRAIGDLPEALKWQLREKESTETLFPDGVHPDLVQSYNNLSLIYKAMGDRPEAKRWRAKADAVNAELKRRGWK